MIRGDDMEQSWIDKNIAYDEILDIVRNCEDIQQSRESDYTKEQAKISAYNEIKEILGIRSQKFCRERG